MDVEPSLQNDESSSRGISERGKRALRVFALAGIVIVASSIAWLYPTMASKTQPVAAPLPTPGLTTKPGDFVSYQFVSPSIGWSLGTSFGPSNPGEFWVSRTVDGAKHWERQLRGQVPRNFTPASSIRFFDKAHGFIALGVPLEVHRTVDGGRSWTTVRLPDEQSSFVTFSDVSHGWLLASAYPGQSGPVRLYRTNDAGDSWLQLPNPPAQSVRVAFRSPSEGWLVTLAQRPVVYLSRDGGNSWQRLDIPDPPGRAQDQTVTVVDLRLLPGIGTVASVAFSDGQGFRLPVHEFTSFDMGRSWRYAPSPTQIQDPTSVTRDAFEDATHWWATDGRSLYKSSDAGQTWKLVPGKLDNGEQWRWYAIQVLDSSHAFCQGQLGQRTGLVMTSDGGLHWTRANVPEPAS